MAPYLQVEDIQKENRYFCKLAPSPRFAEKSEILKNYLWGGGYKFLQNKSIVCACVDNAYTSVDRVLEAMGIGVAGGLDHGEESNWAPQQQLQW